MVRTERCIVCKTSSSATISLLKFPQDVAIMSEWAEFCRVGVAEITARTRICSQHFSPECYKSAVKVILRIVLKKLSEDDILRWRPLKMRKQQYDVDNKGGHLNSPKRHKRTHTGEKPFACDSCDYRAGQLSHLKTHMRTHTGDKPFACGSCDYRAGQPCHLKTHMRTHTGEKPFACDSCDYKAGRLGHLKSHKRTHTGGVTDYQYHYPTTRFIPRLDDRPSGNSYVDDVIVKDELEIKEEPIDDPLAVEAEPDPSVHSTTRFIPRSDDRPSENSYVDDVIIKYELVIKEEPIDEDVTHDEPQADITSTSSYFVLLQADPLAVEAEPDSSVHSEKPFACDICDYRSIYLCNLKTHKRTHTGEKPFACDSCDYRARRLTHLKSHKRTHTGEKPFACDSCDYRAGQLSHLKRHMMTHTGEKPFACDRCGYKTGHLSNLKTHKRTHTSR